MILANHGIISSSGGFIPSTLNNDLIGLYKAESNANNSLGTYNGTALGGLTYTTGQSGDAFNMNGTTSYVNIGNTYNVETNSWSYSFWFNTNQVTGYQTLFSKVAAVGLQGRVWANINVDKIEFNFEALQNSNLITITSNQTINTNTWYNITCVLDRSDKLKLYINGTLTAVTVTSGTNNLVPYVSYNYTNGSPFRFGAYTASDYTTPIALFNGKFDEFGIWNRVLTQSEITELQTKYYPY